MQFKEKEDQHDRKQKAVISKLRQALSIFTVWFVKIPTTVYLMIIAMVK